MSYDPRKNIHNLNHLLEHTRKAVPPILATRKSLLEGSPSMTGLASMPASAKGRTKVNPYDVTSVSIDPNQTFLERDRKEVERLAWMKRIAEGLLGVALRELYAVTAEFESLGGEGTAIPPEKIDRRARWRWLRSRMTALQSRVQQG